MILANIVNLEPRQRPQEPHSPPPRAAAGQQPGGEGGGGGQKPAALPTRNPVSTTWAANATKSTPYSRLTSNSLTDTIPTPIPTTITSLAWPRSTSFNNPLSANISSPTSFSSPSSTPTSPLAPYHSGSADTGAIIGGVCAALVVVAAVGFWMFRQRRLSRSRAGYGTSSRRWFDNEKGFHQGFRQHLGSRSSSPTLSHYDGNGIDHSRDNYHHTNSNNTTSRGPQDYYPEVPTTTGEMRSVPHTLPIDTAVYWPPPPGLIMSDAPPLPPKPSSSPPTESSAILQRNASRNPQDHRRQEQLEHALILQRRQIQELRDLQHRHMRENPLSSMSAPHAPTVEDRQIWQQSDQEQRQLWLRQTGGNSGPVVAAAALAAVAAGGSGSSAISCVCAARDPQDWSSVDNHGGGGVEAEGARNGAEGDESSPPGTGGQQQDLRKYIAQMKEQYEEQFRKHQEELDRLRAEQETQLRKLREQIKE